MDLEKWLGNNLITYKDSFFEFLKEIQPGGSQEICVKPFHPQSNIVILYSETSSSFLKVLKAHNNLVISTRLSEEMERLHVIAMDSNPSLQNGSSSDSSTPDGFSDDVESEANSYFHQMFSGYLTINAMVQMLARFKESSVNREQLIFECMIDNLFEEYRFFPKYPERQLKTAALLFGCVIKHQLVTHLTLGIALHGVLDALRKPLDSKMFVFGTKTLEQFMDRLIEWPKYCNHILQISHLRGTHAELVAFIEQALARISSGHLESDGINNASVAYHHGFFQVASVNGEVGQQLPLHSIFNRDMKVLLLLHLMSLNNLHLQLHLMRLNNFYLPVGKLQLPLQVMFLDSEEYSYFFSFVVFSWFCPSFPRSYLHQVWLCIEPRNTYGCC